MVIYPTVIVGFHPHLRSARPSADEFLDQHGRIYMLTQKSRGWLTLDLTQIVARFPVPLAISVAFAIIANLEIANALDLPSFRWERPSQGVITLDQVYSALASGFFASGAAHLFAEGRRWGRPAGVVLALASAVVVGLICWNMRKFDVQFLFLLPALILAVTVAGFLRRASTGTPCGCSMRVLPWRR